jgi:hypothetical protein
MIEIEASGSPEILLLTGTVRTKIFSIFARLFLQSFVYYTVVLLSIILGRG